MIAASLSTATTFEAIPEAQLSFEQAAKTLDLEPWIVERFRHPAEVATTYLPLTRDSGDPITVTLLRVRHSAVRAAAIGSLSLLPDLRLQQCEDLAMQRSWQAALLGLPLAGASCGLVCDPEELSERELLRLLRAAGRRLGDVATWGSVLFPGRGCRREFAPKLQAAGGDRKLAIAGGPACLGGSDLNLSAAEGIAAVVAASRRAQGRPPEPVKVAIEGFDALGDAVCEGLMRDGMTIVALSDSSGGIYRNDGLILHDVRAHVAREGVLFGYDEADGISRSELLRAAADLLVLTSGANLIHSANANEVAAPIVVEAEWNAIAAGALEQMAGRGVLVIPWLVAGCGALLGAYLESAQPLCPKSDLLPRVREGMKQMSEAINSYADEKGLPFEGASRLWAIERAAEVARAFGADV